MPEAARLNDVVAHSHALGGFITGALIGVAVGAAVVMTGGAALVAVGIVAAGAGIGEFLGSLVKTGGGSAKGGSGGNAIQGACASTVLIGGLKAARVTDYAKCPYRHRKPAVSQGSKTVFIEREPAARKGDQLECGAVVAEGFPSVVIGGEQVSYGQVASEVPAWLEYSALAVGVVSGVGTLGVLRFGASLVCGLVGSKVGEWGGGKLFGEGSLGQKLSQLAGGMVGAVVGARILPRRAPQIQASPPRARSSQPEANVVQTGHPVDVATGRVLTTAIDFEIPGLTPLCMERRYDSSLSWRNSPLGPGWSHSLDQAVWLEPGRVVYRSEDGREIEFDLARLPGRALRAGNEVYDRVNRLTLRCLGGSRWELRGRDGNVRELGPLAGAKAEAPARLLRIRDRAGRALRLEYDAKGNLEWLLDDAGRAVRFEHDAKGRLVRVLVPHPTRDGWVEHTRYVHSEAGDLVEVHDACGHVSRYAYEGHLLVQETDRTGLSFYFAYDGQGADAWCIRTWGDGGIYDHRLDYDEGRRWTTVTNSLGAKTVYHLNEVAAVVRMVDPFGQSVQFEYDEYLRKTAIQDCDGGTVRLTYDARGNCVKRMAPDGATVETEYDEHDQQVALRDANGSEWRWRYDEQGRLVEREGPAGLRDRFFYQGCMCAIERSDGARTLLGHDETGNLTTVTDWDGTPVRYQYDRLSRRVERRDAAGNTERYAYDAAGRLARVQRPDGNFREYVYDAEGNVLEERSPRGAIRLTYTGFHKLASRSQGGATVHLRYDSEDQLVEVENELGEVQRLVWDPCGRVQEQYGFDGQRWRFEHDPDGRLTRILRPSGRSTDITYDPAGRLTAIRHSDGTEESFVYQADGLLVEARNREVALRLERDERGRIVREWQNAEWVASRHGPGGPRVAVESSWGHQQTIARSPAGACLEVSVGTQAPWSAALARDALGRETERRLPGDVSVQWKRDAVGLPLERRVLRGRSAIAAQVYEWGDECLTAVTDAAGGRTVYQHDQRARLLAALLPDGRAERRVPDAAGNLYRQPGRADRRYERGGRLAEADGVRYRYDADGQLVAKELPDGATWSYAYDGAGRMREVVRPDGTRIGFDYDPLGRRVRKTVGERSTTYVWDGDVPLHEIDSAAASPVTWVFEPDTFTLLGKLEGQRRYGVVPDHLGTPSALYDDSGSLAWQMQLDLFGVPQEHSRTVAHTSCPWRWPGQYADEETGLHYNRYRYYDPETGRYLTPDPLGLLGSGLNLYAYPRDPLVQTDPLGLAACTRGRTILTGNAPEDTFMRNAPRAPREPGYWDVIVHGNKEAFGINHGNGRWEVLDAREVASRVRADGWRPPTPIRLIACNAGACPDAIGQDLANELGVIVKAPTGRIAALPWGEFRVGETLETTVPVDTPGAFRYFRPEPRIWVVGGS